MSLSPSHKARIALVVTVVALAATVTVAWAIDLSTDDSGYRIEVVAEGAVLERFDLEDLTSMEARRVRMQLQTQEGPPLLAVLREAGVEEFRSVRVVGTGARDSGQIVLLRREIDQDVLLDIAARGTAKVCGPGIEWEDRVRDVTRIEVR